MNAERLLHLAEHLTTWKRDERFNVDHYLNKMVGNKLEYLISIYDLSHDEAEALFVSGVGRVDTKADGSQMILEMLSPSATRHEVAARIREFVRWKTKDTQNANL